MRKILKKTSPLLMILGLILAVSVTSMGAEKKKPMEGTCGKEAIWSYNKESKTLTIKGKGSIIRKGNGWITSDDEWSNLNIKEIKIKEGITNIGACAFYDLHTVKSVVIPDSVKKIEKLAFSETSITRITIGKNVKKIGKSVFANCYKLKEVNWSADTDTIPMFTFLNCRKLADLKIKSKPKKIGSYALKGTGIKSFNMPNSVESIGKGVFAWDKKLKSVNLSSKITSIPKYTFEYTPKLKKVTMKERIRVIGLGAFHASGIKHIEIPETVTDIGKSAFVSADLVEIKLPDAVKRVKARTFYNCIYLKKVTLGKNVTTLGSEAFDHCEQLTEITIPGSVYEISDWCFFVCENLKQVIIENGVSRIGRGAFYGCEKLERIELPNSLTYIHKEAFLNCDNHLEFFCNKDSLAMEYVTKHNFNYRII